MIERTLSLIKPDAVQRNLTGEILAMIQGSLHLLRMQFWQRRKISPHHRQYRRHCQWY